MDEAETGLKSALAVKIFGQDLKTLEEKANQVKDVLHKVPGTRCRPDHERGPLRRGLSLFSAPSDNLSETMGHRISLTAVVLAALVVAVAARATNLTVNATIAGGSTLSVSSLNTPSFNLTLNGADQTATASHH